MGRAGKKQGKKGKISRAGTGNLLRYRDENRRFKHRVNKLTRRFSGYREQPPKALRGIKNTNPDLAKAIEQKLIKRSN